MGIIYNLPRHFPCLATLPSGRTSALMTFSNVSGMGFIASLGSFFSFILKYACAFGFPQVRARRAGLTEKKIDRSNGERCSHTTASKS